MTALVETMRAEGGAVPLWQLHRRRLRVSCQALGLPPVEYGGSSEAAPHVVRLVVERGGARASVRPLPPTEPVALVTVTEPHPGYPHKLLARHAFDRAGAQALQAGGTEPLLLADGMVAEAARYTVVWDDGRGLAAPSLDLGVLPGVGLARLEQLLGPVRREAVPPGRLRGVPLVLINAVRGVVAVASWDGADVPPVERLAGVMEHFWS